MNLSIIGGSNHMERRLNQNNSNKNSFNLNTSLNPNAAEFVPSSHRNPNPGIGNPGNTNPGNENPGIGSINIPEFIPASLRSPKENGNTGISNSGFGNPNAPEFVPSFMRNQNPGNRNPGNQIPVSKSLDRSDSNKSEDEMRQYWQLPDDITPDFNTLEDKNEPQTISLTNLSINELGLEGTVDRSMWGKQYINGGKQYINGLEASGSELGFGNNGEDLNINNNNNMNPMKFLNLKYPGFSNPALFEVFLKSGRDLSLTMEVLNEIESQNKSKSFVSPNMITLDSPNLFRSLSTPSRRIGDSDLLNDINNNNNNNNHNNNNNVNGNNNNQWRFNRGDASSINHIGSSRLFRNLSGINSSFKSNDDVANGSLGGSTWLETGDNIGNLHLESKEEVRNLALLRNVCLEQARQAYLAGNDSLSKELTLKGQLYNMQIKASQEKAKDALSQHNRSLLMCDTDDRPIDLRGLHASEAIHVLNYELNSRKRAIRGTGRRLETNILVGLAATARGGGMRNNPGRLLGDVEQFLFEHGFRCTQPHPGLLRVVMY